jgi:hypothetical protein
MNFYQERLSPSWWMIAATALFVPASLIIFLPLSVWVGTATGLALWLGSWATLWLFSPVIRVDHDQVRAGRARIDLNWVESMEIFRLADATRERGVSLDARAWLVIRPWIDPVVKITISDPQDPTPYWLVSSKNPEALVALWEDGKTT